MFLPYLEIPPLNLFTGRINEGVEISGKNLDDFPIYCYYKVPKKAFLFLLIFVLGRRVANNR